MNIDERSKRWAKVVAKAWADENYKKRLIADPDSVLREEGLDGPPGVTPTIVENTEKTMYLVLPAMPKSLGNLGQADTRQAAQLCY